jgi:MATE family multidrug resistance protein
MASDLILTTVSLGLGVASSHRIGKYLGAGNGRYARLACLSPYLFSFLVGLLEFGVLFLSSNVYGNLFTTDTQVVEMTARILPLMAGFQVLDLANGGAGGILRGAGKNHLSGASNFLAYYGVGLTTAWVFCFKKGWGLIGLWAGIILGSACLLVLQTIFVSLVQWEYESEKIGKSSNTLESEEAT